MSVRDRREANVWSRPLRDTAVCSFKVLQHLIHICPISQTKESDMDVMVRNSEIEISLAYNQSIDYTAVFRKGFIYTYYFVSFSCHFKHHGFAYRIVISEYHFCTIPGYYGIVFLTEVFC